MAHLADELVAGHGVDAPQLAAVPGTASPTWFGPPESALFGWVHRPESGTARGAVLLCPPLARERAAAHSTYRLLAERLAADGLLALRFDYDGTGDSSGGDGDPGRVDAWLSSIRWAATLARRCGAPQVALVGMRMGALLAATACTNLVDPAALVLWDPCRSGRSFVREQSALHAVRLEAPQAGVSGVELPGYEFTPETASALSALEMPDFGLLEAPVLVLERPGTRATRPGGQAMPECIEFGEAPGQDLLLDVESLAQVIPETMIRRVAEWLGTTLCGSESTVCAPSREEAVVRGRDGEVTERIVRLGPLGLFGIEATCDPAAALPTVLMLNTGNEWHAGPNRLWVDLSRRWALLGFRCVRFDESGLGDSPARPGRARHVVRAPEAFDDVEDVAAAVSPGDPDDVVLVGLCSGAYQALEHALRHSPRAVCAVNPILHFRPPELSGGTLDPRRRICRPATVAVRAYRKVPMGKLRRSLRGPLWRSVRLIERWRSSGSWPAELAASRTSVLLVGGPDELRPVLEFAQVRSSGEVRIGGAMEVEVVPGLDHGLVVAAQRHAVAQRLTDHLVRTFLPTTARPVPEGPSDGDTTARGCSPRAPR